MEETTGPGRAESGAAAAAAAPEAAPPGPSAARTGVFAAVVLAILSVLFVADHDAWTPDEPRVAELARSVAHGSWAAPRLNGKPFLEQPPLYYWSVAGAYRLFGATPAVARAVSALFGALTLLLTYLFAARLGGRRAGALAALALGFSFQFFWVAHRIVVDGALAFFVTLSATAALYGFTARRPRGRTAGLALCYAAASLAYLSKGAVGIGLSGFAFLAIVAARREPRALLRAHLWAAPLIFLAITTPYHLSLHRDLGWEGLKTVIVTNTVERAGVAGGEPAHAGAVYYYLTLFFPNLLPAGVFFLGGVVDLARMIEGRRPFAPSERFAYEMPLIWFGLGLLALSAALAKREMYMVPLFPAAAAVSGLWLERVLSGRAEGAVEGRLARALPLLLAALLAAAGLALPVAAFGLGLRPAVPVLGGAAALAAAAAGFRLARRGPGPSLAALSAGAVFLLALAGASVVPMVDAEKRLGPILEEAGRLIPAGRPIYVLHPDETASGAIPFYTGRGAIPVIDRAELERALAGVREAYVYVIDKHDDMRLFKSVEDLRPEVLRALVRPRSRSVRLLRFSRE